MSWDYENAIDQVMKGMHRIFLKLQEILNVEIQIRDLLVPRPVSLKVHFSGESMPLLVGSTTTATVTVLDQTGQPFPFDFTANPPQWTVDPNCTIAPGTTPADEVFTGVAAGTENWSVMVPTVANPTASGSFEVHAAAVATSVSVSFNPAVA